MAGSSVDVSKPEAALAPERCKDKLKEATAGRITVESVRSPVEQLITIIVIVVIIIVFIDLYWSLLKFIDVYRFGSYWISALMWKTDQVSDGTTEVNIKEKARSSNLASSRLVMRTLGVQFSDTTFINKSNTKLAIN